MSNNMIKTLLVLVILILNACGRSEKSAPSASGDGIVQNDLIRVTASQFDQGGMKLGKLREIVFNDEIQVTGKIDVPPQNKAVVSIPLGGYVTNTTLLIGDRVKKGQVLLTLENPEFIRLQQNYLETKEKLSYLKAEYERHQTLYQENITSEKNFLKAESEYKTNMARYNGLKQQLGLLHISSEQVDAGNITAQTYLYAPIDGSISKMNITKGAYISPATEILEIINTDHIHLELSVFEKDILPLKEGQSIVFSTPEASDKLHRGNVHRIGSSIDENRRVLVHGHIEETSEFNFISGMFVNAEIIINARSQSALPETAVVEAAERNFVLKLMSKTENEYVFKPLEVEVYDTESGFVAIGPDELVNPQDEFLTAGGFALIGSY